MHTLQLRSRYVNSIYKTCVFNLQVQFVMTFSAAKKTEILSKGNCSNLLGG